MISAVKGFVLKPQEGIDIDKIKDRLSEIIEEGYLNYVEATRMPYCDIHMLKNKHGRVDIHNVEIDLPEIGLIVLISDPEYHKLINPSTEEPSIPKKLKDYLLGIEECKIRTILHGAQG